MGKCVFAEKSKEPTACFWTAQDILRYIKEKDVPYCNEVYGEIVEDDGVLRCTKASHTGCMFCGFGAQSDKNNRFEQLKLQHPKLYDYGLNRLGMREVIDYVNYQRPAPLEDHASEPCALRICCR